MRVLAPTWPSWTPPWREFWGASLQPPKGRSLDSTTGLCQMDFGRTMVFGWSGVVIIQKFLAKVPPSWSISQGAENSVGVSLICTHWCFWVASFFNSKSGIIGGKRSSQRPTTASLHGFLGPQPDYQPLSIFFRYHVFLAFALYIMPKGFQLYLVKGIWKSLSNSYSRSKSVFSNSRV